ncbi:hypothetical protein DACRYDRAFT_100640 [Dacryopinax primogenitus]|uniref:catechol O-methyltransferase n=1 Tax=Dacryopinax primogenitus (strain DJM 731) TaxID=1858805 RepID=M5FZ78_DACPD|nr:uncharacterized protein DACRYDRAFT_100640 [Dacryopinax primogenitus]EJU01175.1 hypothetical protein DACRYDRAFT_100640 [Dacryopinax primogenitus]
MTSTMTTTCTSTAMLDRPTLHTPVGGYSSFSGDGREERLVSALLAHKDELQGKPQAVLEAIDRFAEGEYLMNVGAHKGQVVEEIIKEKGAKLILELGTYVGYSAIKFARHLLSLHPNGVLPPSWPSSPPLSSDARQFVGYICLEKSASYAHVANTLLGLAGLGDITKILIGPSTRSILKLHALLPALAPGTQFDLVFLDHHKPHYTMDLKALEEGGWVGKGTTVVADNVIKPGNPRYLAYVRGKTPVRIDKEEEEDGEEEGEEEAEAAQTKVHVGQGGEEAGEGVGEKADEQATELVVQDVELVGQDDTGDVLEELEEVDEETGTVIAGVKRLRYESMLVMSWDPYTGEDDGVEVSTCVGLQEEM